MTDLSFARRAAMLGAATLAALPAAATGVPPLQGANPLRFSRLKIGDVEVTTLPDGAVGGINAGIQNFFPRQPPRGNRAAARARLRQRGWAAPAGGRLSHQHRP